jgi:glutamate carboxypeptidase
MTDPEVSAVRDFLAARRHDVVDLLMELANLESPSLVPESQHATQELLTRRLKAIGFVSEFFPGEKTGGHVYLSPEAPNGAASAGDGAPVQLLLGHTDTVWPVGTVTTCRWSGTKKRTASEVQESST